MMTCAAPLLPAATVNWGSPYFSDLATSTGDRIEAGFTFELGVFADSFVPTAENVNDWESNWKTFDVASYDEESGYFTGTADIMANGSSSSPVADVGVNFSEREAYVWVYNSSSPGSNSEWFLARSAGWVLPSAPEDDCCDGRLPLQWSIDDLATGESPVVGGHGEAAGGGTVSQQGVYSLQTYVVPEPGSLLLAAVSLGVCLRRRRKVESSN